MRIKMLYDTYDNDKLIWHKDEIFNVVDFESINYYEIKDKYGISKDCLGIEFIILKEGE